MGQVQKVQKVEGLENLRTLQNELNQAKKLVTPRRMSTCLEPAAARACGHADLQTRGMRSYQRRKPCLGA